MHRGMLPEHTQADTQLQTTQMRLFSFLTTLPIVLLRLFQRVLGWAVALGSHR